MTFFWAKKSKFISILTLALTVFLSLPSVHAKDDKFEFIVLGDTAYRGAKDYPAYQSLIEKINSRQPSFTVHIGDIWGVGPCTDENYERIKQFFDSYDQPVILTPGDNEWTDCHPVIMGGFDPVERLQKLRSSYFSTAYSMGKTKLPVIRQADVSDHKDFVENLRWEKQGVLFVTIHVVGSANNLVPHSETVFKEFFHRDKANLAWIDDSFRIAIEEKFKAVVILFHGNMFDFDKAPFKKTNKSIRIGAERFGKPVLLVHGDSHLFLVDKPYFEEDGELGQPEFDNVTRLQVYGPQTVRAVRVSVEPSTPWVFGFTPFYEQ